MISPGPQSRGVGPRGGGTASTAFRWAYASWDNASRGVDFRRMDLCNPAAKQRCITAIDGFADRCVFIADDSTQAFEEVVPAEGATDPFALMPKHEIMELGLRHKKNL